MARLRRRFRLFWPVLILLATLTVLVTGSPLPSADRPADLSVEGPESSVSIVALVPAEILLEDLQEGAGVAIAPDGTIFVADRKTAVIYQYSYQHDSANPSVTMPFAGPTQLQAPVGLWVEEAEEEDTSLLVADEGRGQVLRLDGRADVVAEGLKKPRWLVSDGNATGPIYVTADGLSEQAGMTGPSRREGSVLLRIPRLPAAPAPAEVLLAGLRRPQGLAAPVNSILPVAVEGFQQTGEAQGPAILGIRLDLAPGNPEYTRALLGPGVLQPGGMARDALGALWLAAGQWRDPASPSSPPVHGVVAKVLPGGGVSIVARGADSPQGLAFGSDGHLYLAERSRLLRFRAPAPPHLSPEPPTYTNRPTLQLAGTALPGALITARISSETTIAQADPQTGIFYFSEALQLQANRENTVEAFATSLAGFGLTSAPVAFPILHDDVAPAVSTRTDPAEPYVRGQVRLIAEAQDPVPEGGSASGLARLILRFLLTPAQLMGHPLNQLAPHSPLSPNGEEDEAEGGRRDDLVTLPMQASIDATPTEISRASAEGSGTHDPLMAALPLESSSLPDGPYTLEATAEDYAGNLATVSQPRTLDNTPPTVGILGVSNGVTVRGTLQVEVISADTTSGLDRVELALDGRPALTSREAPLRAIFDSLLLPPGPHTLLARATDRAGNEATKTVYFTVANLTIHLVGPPSGSTVPNSPVWVQGTVESPAPEVGVVVNDVIAHVHGGTFAALVPLDAGTGTLTVLATDSFGATARTTGTVTVASGPPAPDLRITPESGLAPLSVEFTTSASPGAGTTFTLDFGDGSPPHVAASIEGVSHTYALPGLYFPTLTVTDPTGQRTTVRAIVQTHEAFSLDVVLRSKWDSLRAALGRGDIGAALGFVATSAREKYRRVFQDLGTTLLSVAGQLQEIHLLEVLPGFAGFATYRQRGGETFLYFIEFVQDADGIWRIETM